MPKRGDIAVCSAGFAGVVLSTHPMDVKYPDGSTGVAWTGVHLENRSDRNVKAGDPWSSRNPEVIGNIVDLWEETCDKWRSGYSWLLDALRCHILSCGDHEMLEHFQGRLVDDKGC